MTTTIQPFNLIRASALPTIKEIISWAADCPIPDCYTIEAVLSAPLAKVIYALVRNDPEAPIVDALMAELVQRLQEGFYDVGEVAGGFQIKSLSLRADGGEETSEKLPVTQYAAVYPDHAGHLFSARIVFSRSLSDDLGCGGIERFNSLPVTEALRRQLAAEIDGSLTEDDDLLFSGVQVDLGILSWPLEVIEQETILIGGTQTYEVEVQETRTFRRTIAVQARSSDQAILRARAVAEAEAFKWGNAVETLITARNPTPAEPRDPARAAPDYPLSAGAETQMARSAEQRA